MYDLVVLKEAQKYLSKMPTRDRVAVNYSLTILAEGTWENLDISRLSGLGNDYSYRIRVGKYRVLFECFENQCIIRIIKIGPRGDVYK